MGMRALSLSGHSIVQAIPRDDDDILLSLDDGGWASAANDGECPVSNTRDSSLGCVETCQRRCEAADELNEIIYIAFSH